MADSPTPPAPAETAVEQSSTTALAADAVTPAYFVPQATQDNYAQIIRDQAVLRGVEFATIATEYAEQWERMHERQPLDGYDHLAAWVREFDPGSGLGPTGLAVLQARALESARRDPYQAVIGDQALVEQAVAAQAQADAAALGTATAPSVDPATGVLPNAGPVSPPPEVVDPESGVVAQAAAEQQGDSPPPSAPSAGNEEATTDTSSSPAPDASSPSDTDTSTSSTTTSKRSSSASSS